MKKKTETDFEVIMLFECGREVLFSDDKKLITYNNKTQKLYSEGEEKNKTFQYSELPFHK